MSEQQITTGIDPTLISGNCLAEGESQLVGYLNELRDERQEDGTPLSADIVADRMIGAIVALGVMESSEESGKYPFMPFDTIQDLIIEAKDVGQNYIQSDWDKTLSRFTRKQGIRKMAEMLLTDPETSKALSERVIPLPNPDRQVVALNSKEMLRGYLAFKLQDALKNNPDNVDNATGWEEDMIEQVVVFANNATDPRQKDWKSLGQLSQSENENLRQSGNNFKVMLERARKAGVDLELVDKTAEVLWRRAQKAKLATRLASTAISG